MRVIVDDGVRLEVRVAGPEAPLGPPAGAGAAPRPPLVLVHGLGGAKEDFADHVGTLAEHGPVVTFDLRGHGDSDFPDDPDAYGLDRLAADTLQVADALGLASFGLLGHSMGGMVARRVVLRASARVAALVLMDTSPGPPPGMDSEIIELGAEIVTQQGVAELKRVMDVLDPLDSPSYQRVLAERPGYREYTEWKWSRLSAVMYGAMLREIDRQPDQLESLRDVRTPTLVLVGEEDATFVGASRDMAAAIPGAALAVIPGAGHSPQFENPTEWYRVLDTFLDGSYRP